MLTDLSTLLVRYLKRQGVTGPLASNAVLHFRIIEKAKISSEFWREEQVWHCIIWSLIELIFDFASSKCSLTLTHKCKDIPTYFSIIFCTGFFTSLNNMIRPQLQKKYKEYSSDYHTWVKQPNVFSKIFNNWSNKK